MSCLVTPANTNTYGGTDADDSANVSSWDENDTQDAELASIMAAWATLPDHIRASIMETVRLATVYDVNVNDKPTGDSASGNIVDGGNAGDPEGEPL